MKTTINSEGVLSIAPESELENFALNKWLEDYQKDKATLEVVRNKIKGYDHPNKQFEKANSK